LLVNVMHDHEKIDYVEFPAVDLEKTKEFFRQAFGWTFEDFGPTYTAFADQGLDGGFYQSELQSQADKGGALIVFYSEDIEATLQKVTAAGGKINKPIFSFPGGRRFHFIEPSGNEFSVWADNDKTP